MSSTIKSQMKFEGEPNRKHKLQNAAAMLDTLPTEVRLLRLEALVQASVTLNRAANLADILLSILNLITSQLECDRATTFLRDEDTGRLRARQMAGSQFFDIELDEGRGIAGYVVQTGESVRVDDAHTDARFDASTDKRTGYRTKSILCVPLKNAEGKIIGALQAINRVEGTFQIEDLTYLEAFAVLAALAVERDKLTQVVLRAHMLSKELKLAREIQTRLLPAQGTLSLPAPFRAYGASVSCYDVGGDMYDAVILKNGDCAFWVADVSGKGIGAALLMTSLQTELRALVHFESNLAALATLLNTHVRQAAPMGTYATLFIGILNAARRELTYVNAGHQPPLWFDNIADAVSSDDFDSKLNTTRLQTGGFPIGLLPDVTYERGIIEFPAAARLVVFSDGMIDAQNTATDTYEEAGIIESLSRAQPVPVSVEDLGMHLLHDLEHFRRYAAPQDDTTLFVIGLD